MIKKTAFLVATIVSMLILVRCAKEGVPTGGPKDEAPPVFVKSTPLPNTLNYKGKDVKITFDENVVLKDISNNFIMSPPMEKDPDVNAYGKEIQVDLENELQPNTTYTLYFGNGIVDNNEGNVIPNFTFSFSTGAYIDSLEMSGILLDARNLEPMKNTLIGVYTNHHDTAVIKNVPIRIAQTGSEGIFTIMNLPDSAYHIFGWGDVDKNYRYTEGEKFSYLDTIYRPYFDTIQVVDTVWADSLTVDTIIFSDTLVYLPDDIILKAFSVEKYFQTLKKKKRETRRKIVFEFASAVTDTPKMVLLDTLANNWFQFEKSVTGDTLLAWITDSLVYKKDTLNVSFSYQKTDSVQALYWQTDTIAMNFRDKKKAKPRRNKKKEVEGFVPPKEVERFTFTTTIKNTQDVNKPIYIDFAQPVKTIIRDSIRLVETVDTIKTNVKFSFKQHKILPRRYIIDFKWNEENSYELVIDSAAFISIYNAVSDNSRSPFNIKGVAEFGEIIFEMVGIEENGFIELLNAKDEPIRSLPFSPSKKTVTFSFLEPGTFYARLFIDANNNGEWDTGNYLEKIQPEEVIYFPKAIQVKKNWTMEEEWDILSVPIHEQKPEAIKNLKKDKN